MTILQVSQLTKNYRNGRGANIHALQDVSLTVNTGEVLGVVGESGCGKSTLGRSVMRLTEPDSGSIKFDGIDVLTLKKAELKHFRSRCQMIFQDPFGSLNPHHKVGTIISEPLKVHRRGSSSDIRNRVEELLNLVGLPEDAATRHPHEFSGGQRQRIAIARALVLEPDFIVADEAVSALDVSVQSQIINLIISLKRQLNLSMMFISHDLSVVRHICDRIAVMYFGRIVEIGQAQQIMQHPQHPYTKALIAAIPNMTGELVGDQLVQGEMPDPAKPPKGCAFSSRCPAVMSACEQVRPKLVRRATTLSDPTSYASHSQMSSSETSVNEHQLACHLNEPLQDYQ